MQLKLFCAMQALQRMLDCHTINMGTWEGSLSSDEFMTICRQLSSGLNLKKVETAYNFIDSSLPGKYVFTQLNLNYGLPLKEFVHVIAVHTPDAIFEHDNAYTLVWAAD